MKRFHFPLDRVLRFRQLQAEAEEARLQAHLTRLKQVDERIAQLEREGSRTEEGVRQSLAANREVMPGVLNTYPAYRLVLARGKRAILEDRRRVAEEVERQRKAVIEARRAREILQRAREHALERWRSDYGKEQDEMASELFLSKWKR